VCLNKIKKPPVGGGQGPKAYRDCRATDDDQYPLEFTSRCVCMQYRNARSTLDYHCPACSRKRRREDSLLIYQLPYMYSGHRKMS
jgi:hypothetical protein